jgi:hypothetical protein
MAVALSFSTETSYIGFDGSESQAVTLPTGGAMIAMIKWDYGSTNVANIGSISLSTDGAADDVTGLLLPGNGKGMILAYWDNITTASQNILYTNSGQYVEGTALFFTVTGHDTAAPFGRETTDATAATLNFTFDTTGDLAFVGFWGTEVTTLSFGEGTWTCPGTMGSGVTYWSANLTAGTKSIGVFDGVPNEAAILEIKAAGGGSTVPLSGSALTGGQGSASPGTAINL